MCDKVLQSTWCPLGQTVGTARTFLMKRPLLTPSRCWQKVLTTQHNVFVPASAPPCTCFSQCCYSCHKPCRVPFLSSFVLPSSTLPPPYYKYNTHWLVLIHTWLTDTFPDWTETVNLNSVAHLILFKLHIFKSDGSSETRGKVSRCQPVVLHPAARLCFSVRDSDLSEPTLSSELLCPLL